MNWKKLFLVLAALWLMVSVEKALKIQQDRDHRENCRLFLEAGGKGSEKAKCMAWLSQ